MAKKGTALTPKQRHFCRAVAAGSTLSGAYTEAYSTSRMNKTTIGREATRLMSNPLITTHVETLNRAKDRAVIASSLSDGFYPDKTDSSEKPENGRGGGLCQNAESIQTNSNWRLYS